MSYRRRHTDHNLDYMFTAAWSWTDFLPVHGVGLVSTVGDAVEQVAHAGILSALLSRAEMVIHHFVYDVVRDSTAAV